MRRQVFRVIEEQIGPDLARGQIVRRPQIEHAQFLEILRRGPSGVSHKKCPVRSEPVDFLYRSLAEISPRLQAEAQRATLNDRIWFIAAVSSGILSRGSLI